MRKSTTFRKVIVAFGSIFSNIEITRQDDGDKEQTIAVPIAQGSKEKWLRRLESDPTLENQTAVSLPRMSYILTGVGYDVSRKTSTVNKIVCPSPDGTTTYTMSPAPYNLDFTLSILTKSQEDAFSIVEQIISKFNPELTITIKNVDEVNIQTPIPIILQTVSVSDTSDGDFQERRLVVWDISFEAKCLFYPKVQIGSVVISSDSDGNVTPSAGVEIHGHDMVNRPQMCSDALRIIDADPTPSSPKPYILNEIVT